MQSEGVWYSWVQERWPGIAVSLTGILDTPGGWRVNVRPGIVASERRQRPPALGNFSGEGVLEKEHLSKRFSFLLFKCLFYLFIYRIIFPCLCHFTGSLLKNPKQIRVRPLLVSWSQEWFFPSHSSVLTLPIYFLIYNLNPHATANLILSIHRKQREYFSLGVEGFVAKYFFLWGQLLKCFSGNSVGNVFWVEL